MKPELISLNQLQHLCSVLPFTKSKYDASEASTILMHKLKACNIILNVLL
jgi:hypothetical protein